MTTALRPITTLPDASVYEKVNEGAGGCYERIAFSRMLSRLAHAHGAKKILEYEASYIAGIPGFNSCLLAREGFDVTVLINERDFQDARHAWEMLGLLGPNVHLILDDGRTKFKNRQFDMVWNHLALEHYEKPELLTNEMKRISSGLVVNLTLAPYNFGFLMHWFNHWSGRKPWDHGTIRNTTIGAMKRAHKASGLDFVEAGACDVPPWMDTVDAKMKGSMTYLDTYPAAVRKRWIWCSADPSAQDKAMIKFFWHMETHMPEWFKVLVGHHLYVASKVA